jgi:beta-lactamase regulating signal transducer with metallopeptidase domain
MNSILWWAAQNTLSVAALMPVVGVACWFLRSRPAAQHLLWMLLLVKLVAPPVVDWPWTLEEACQLVSVAWTSEAAPVETMVAAPAPEEWVDETILLALPPDMLENVVAAQAVDAPISSDVVAPPPAQSWNAATIVLGAWGAGAAFCLLLAVRDFVRQARVVRRARVPSAMLIVALQRAAERLRMRPVRAAVSDRVNTPVVCCLGRPRLVWPQAMHEPEVIAGSDGILAHELAHIARRDHLLVYFELIVLACHWWNPLAWYIRRRVHETRELACDALALAGAEQSRDDYARRLLTLSVEQHASMSLAPAFGAGVFSRRFLQRRLRMVFDPRTSGRITVAGAALAGLLSAAALPGFSWAYQQSADAAPAAQNTAAYTTISDDAPPSPEGVTTTISADVTVKPEVGTEAAVTINEARVVLDDGAGDGPKPKFTTKYDEGSGRQSFKLADGGTLEISHGDQGQLVLTIQQSDHAPQQFRYVIAHDPRQTKVLTEEVRGADVTFTTKADTATTAAPAADNAVQLYTAKIADIASTERLNIAVNDDARAILESDLQLAEVNLEEKRAELEVAIEEHASEGKRKLAQLAIRRAEIELARCKLKLQRNQPATVSDEYRSH